MCISSHLAAIPGELPLVDELGGPDHSTAGGVFNHNQEISPVAALHGGETLWKALRSHDEAEQHKSNELKSTLTHEGGLGDVANLCQLGQELDKA